jgi:hypothetical protein
MDNKHGYRSRHVNQLNWVNIHSSEYLYMEEKPIQLGYLRQILLNNLHLLVFLHVDVKHLHASECTHQLLWKIFYTVVYLHVDQKHHYHYIWLQHHQLVDQQQLLRSE